MSELVPPLESIPKFKTIDGSPARDPLFSSRSDFKTSVLHFAIRQWRYRCVRQSIFGPLYRQVYIKAQAELKRIEQVHTRAVETK